MNENKQQLNVADKKVSDKRRLFVKGAVGAVPAVLTLRSGAAFALTSAEMCNIQDNAIAGGANLRVAADTNDIWLRQETLCRDLSNGVRVYPDPFIANEWRAEDYLSATSSGNKYEEVLPATIPATMQLVGTTSPVYTYTESTCFVLAIMTNSGTAIDLGNAVDGQNGNPGLPYITASCWASASPDASANGLQF